MGFGSYDEASRKDQDVDTDDDNAVNVHENDHDGEVTIEGGASTDDLVGALGDDERRRRRRVSHLSLNAEAQFFR